MAPTISDRRSNGNKAPTSDETPPRARRQGVPFREFFSDQNQGKFITRGELLSVLNIILPQAIENHRRTRTLTGRLAAWWATLWAPRTVVLMPSHDGLPPLDDATAATRMPDHTR